MHRRRGGHFHRTTGTGCSETSLLSQGRGLQVSRGSEFAGHGGGERLASRRMYHDITLPRRKFLRQTTAAGIALTAATTAQAEAASTPITGSTASSRWGSSAAAGGEAGSPDCSSSTAATSSSRRPTTSWTARKDRRVAGRRQGEVLLRPVGLQAADRKRRGGRDPGNAALLFSPTCGRRRRRRPARLHGQARGRGRAGHAQDRRPGGNGRREELVFLVDYQMPTDPMNIEVRKRLRQAAGRLADGLLRGQGRRR